MRRTHVELVAEQFLKLPHADAGGLSKVRAVEADPGGQPRLAVLDGQGAGRRDAGAQLGPHRQHRVQFAGARRTRTGPLHGQQGRSDRPDPRTGQRPCTVRHHGQRRRTHRFAYARGTAEYRRANPRRSRPTASHQTRRDCGRYHWHGLLSYQRRQRIYYRPNRRRRRWPAPGLAFAPGLASSTRDRRTSRASLRSHRPGADAGHPRTDRPWPALATTGRRLARNHHRRTRFARPRQIIVGGAVDHRRQRLGVRPAARRRSG